MYSSETSIDRIWSSKPRKWPVWLIFALSPQLKTIVYLPLVQKEKKIWLLVKRLDQKSPPNAHCLPKLSPIQNQSRWLGHKLGENTLKVNFFPNQNFNLHFLGQFCFLAAAQRETDERKYWSLTAYVNMFGNEIFMWLIVPDRPFHNLRASKSGDRRVSCPLKTTWDGFWSFKDVKESAGQ